MIMPRGRPMLGDANPRFIYLSLFVTFSLNILPLGTWVWMPDVLMVTLAIWSMREPRWVGMGLAFVLGLCMDVQQRTLLGEHAMTYALVIFLVQHTRKRLEMFSPLVQVWQVLPIFALAHALQMLVRVAAGGIFPGLWLILAPLIEAALWPLLTALLLIPQRRTQPVDGIRPL